MGPFGIGGELEPHAALGGLLDKGIPVEAGADGSRLAGLGVLGREAMRVRPVGEEPDVGIEIGKAGLVAEIGGADEFLEVSAFFALRHRVGAVFGEDCFK